MHKPFAAELIFYWILFAVTGVFAVLIFSPYLTSLFLALVLSIMFGPAHEWFLRRFRVHESVAALFSTFLVAMFILVPIVFFGVLLFGEVVQVYAAATDAHGSVALFDQYTHRFETFIQQYVPSFEVSIDGEAYVGRALGWIVGNLNEIFSRLMGGILNFFIILVALFFFFRDGDSLRESLIKWSPLSDKRDEGILDRVTNAVASVVKGSLLIALLQGVLTSIGFIMVGIPNPVLWGAVAMFCALIPSVGTAIVNIPGVVYLLFAGSIPQSVVLLIWSVAVVGMIDNVLRPILIIRGVNIHPFVILLSVLGGLSLFGPIGFIAGPVLMSLFFALAEIYPNIMRGTAIPDVPPDAVK